MTIAEIIEVYENLGKEIFRIMLLVSIVEKLEVGSPSSSVTAQDTLREIQRRV